MKFTPTNHFKQTCPYCKKRLLTVSVGSQIIGSPLITCRKCGRTYRTNLRTEWYEYPQKWTLVGIPLIVTFTMLLTGCLMGDSAIGIITAFLALIISLCFSIKNLIRMIVSKKRMRNAKYLAQLLHYDLITSEQYENFMRKAK